MNKDIPALLGGKPIYDDVLPLARPFLPDFKKISKEMEGLFESGQITNSKYVEEFEKAAAEYFGVKHVIALSSCTSGLILALNALKLSGEVILPSFTFFASGHALLWNKLEPVLVDCESDTFCISIPEIEKNITDKTSAILAVDIFGNTPNIDELDRLAKKHNLKLIFDSAHAFGSMFKGKKVGSFGEAEVFSLSPSKVLTTGEGGLVATNNYDIARMVKIGRDYGNPGTYDAEYAGLSVRMTEFSGLLGLRSMDSLENIIDKRNVLAKRYVSKLSKIPGLSFQKISPENRSTYKMFAVLVDENKFGISRDIVVEALTAENIQTRKYFYPPMHEQKIYKKFKKGLMTSTDKITSEVICLPMNIKMNESDVDKVCVALERIYASRKEFKN